MCINAISQCSQVRVLINSQLALCEDVEKKKTCLLVMSEHVLPSTAFLYCRLLPLARPLKLKPFINKHTKVSRNCSWKYCCMLQHWQDDDQCVYNLPSEVARVRMCVRALAKHFPWRWNQSGSHPFPVPGYVVWCLPLRCLVSDHRRDYSLLQSPSAGVSQSAHHASSLFYVCTIVCAKESPRYLLLWTAVRTDELCHEPCASIAPKTLLLRNRKTFFFSFLLPSHFGNMRRLRTHSWPAHQLWCTQPRGLRQPRLWSQMADSTFIMSCFHRLVFFLLFWCCCFWALYFWRVFLLLPFTSREAPLK